MPIKECSLFTDMQRYIGETEQTLNGRCRGHKSNMRSNSDNIVSRHYKEYNHTGEDYIVTAIDKETDYNKRLRLEETWIILLELMPPKGLNSRMRVIQVYQNTKKTAKLNWNGTKLEEHYSNHILNNLEQIITQETTPMIDMIETSQNKGNYGKIKHFN